jgi:integrase
MPTDTLTDAKCKAAKPGPKPYKVFDGGGMALWISPKGAKVWRLHYRIDGKAQTKSLGPYPEVTLAEARRLRDEARRKVRAGEALSAPRAAAVVTVEQACRDYWAGRPDTTEGYRSDALRMLELHVWPAIGSQAVANLTRADVLAPLLVLDAAGKPEAARRTRGRLSQVLAWCVERGHCAVNHAAGIKPERAFGRRTVEHHPALELKEVGELMRRLELEGELQSAIGCKLLALAWVRTGELRMMRWDELDGELWRLPAGRMKRRRDHLVPLSRQALALLARMKERHKGSEYVFPAPHRLDRPMSENAILYLLARMGYGGKMSGHGWRTVASTWAHEGGYPADVIERQLAHTPEDKVRSAYNRAQHLPERAAMLQAYADWLDVQAGSAKG